MPKEFSIRHNLWVTSIVDLDVLSGLHRFLSNRIIHISKAIAVPKFC
jgi:hypothetical protein